MPAWSIARRTAQTALVSMNVPRGKASSKPPVSACTMPLSSSRVGCPRKNTRLLIPSGSLSGDLAFERNTTSATNGARALPLVMASCWPGACLDILRRRAGQGEIEQHKALAPAARCFGDTDVIGLDIAMLDALILKVAHCLHDGEDQLIAWTCDLLAGVGCLLCISYL